MAEVMLHESLLLAYSTTTEGNMDERFSERSVVMQNRRKFFNPLGINPRFTIEGKQIHSDRILYLDKENTKMWFGMNIPGVDGFITDQNDVATIIKVADCVPVVLYDPEHKASALLHAGWQGAAKKIHEKGLRMMQHVFGTNPEQVLVWLGPSAQKCCFSSAEKPTQIEDEAWKPFLKEKNGEWEVDLTGFIKETLADAGVVKKNILVDKHCTVESTELFSHTRSKKQNEPEGRFIVLVKIR